MATAGLGGRGPCTDIRATIPSGRRPMSPSLVSVEAALGSALVLGLAAVSDATAGRRSDRVTGITRGTADLVAARVLWASTITSTKVLGRSAEIERASSPTSMQR